MMEEIVIQESEIGICEAKSNYVEKVVGGSYDRSGGVRAEIVSGTPSQLI